MFNDEGFKVPSYSKFVAQRNVIDRYKSACKMFIELFILKYKDNINNINDLFNNNEFEVFINMLVKTKNRFDESTKINEELLLLLKKFEKDMIFELFDNTNINKDDIETSIFLTLEKIYNEDNNIDLSNVKYSVFNGDHFKGILLVINNDKYIKILNYIIIWVMK